MNVLSNDYFEEGKTIIQSFEHKDKISLNYTNDRINKLLNDKEVLQKPSHDLEFLDTCLRIIDPLSQFLNICEASLLLY